MPYFRLVGKILFTFLAELAEVCSESKQRCSAGRGECLAKHKWGVWHSRSRRMHFFKATKWKELWLSACASPDSPCFAVSMLSWLWESTSRALRASMQMEFASWTDPDQTPHSHVNRAPLQVTSMLVFYVWLKDCVEQISIWTAPLLCCRAMASSCLARDISLLLCTSCLQPSFEPAQRMPSLLSPWRRWHIP